MVPFHNPSNRRASLGLGRGRFIVPFDFDAPLPEDILAAFEGGEDDIAFDAYSVPFAVGCA